MKATIQGIDYSNINDVPPFARKHYATLKAWQNDGIILTVIHEHKQMIFAKRLLHTFDVMDNMGNTLNVDVKHINLINS